MELTKCGYLLLFCAGLSVLLFACLSYAAFFGRRVRRSEEFEQLESGAD